MTTRRIRVPPANCLVGFEAVCRHQNISRASDDLCVTQAAVSRQISGLERLLGVALFHRCSHGVLLTPEGEKFAKVVIPALDSISKAVASMGSAFSLADHLNVFAKGCISVQWLTPDIHRFQEVNPRARITVFSSANTLETKANQIDIAMQYGQMNLRGFESAGQWNDEVVISCSPEFRRRLPDDLKLENISDYPLIYLEGEGRAIWTWGEFLDKHGINKPPAHINLSFSSYQDAIDSAHMGRGLLLGTRFLVNRSIQNGRLVQVGSFSVPSRKDLNLFVRSSVRMSTVAQRLVCWIKSEVDSILSNSSH